MTPRQIYVRLKLRIIDTYVYRFDFKKDVIPEVATGIPVTFVVETKGDQIQFKACEGEKVAAAITGYRSNTLGKHLGYTTTPIIGNGSTKEEFRGKNIYPFLLVNILEYYKNTLHASELLGFTHPDNIAVERSLAKAGFTIIRRARIYRFLGIKLFKKEYAV